MQVIIDIYVQPQDSNKFSYYVTDVANFSFPWTNICEFKFTSFKQIRNKLFMPDDKIIIFDLVSQLEGQVQLKLTVKAGVRSVYEIYQFYIYF